MVDNMATDELVAKDAITDEKPEEKAADKPSELIKIVQLVEKSVKTKETRMLSGRLMRMLVTARKNLTSDSLTTFLKTVLPVDSECRPFLLEQVQKVGHLRINAKQAGRGFMRLVDYVCRSLPFHACRLLLGQQCRWRRARAVPRKRLWRQC